MRAGFDGPLDRQSLSAAVVAVVYFTMVPSR